LITKDRAQEILDMIETDAENFNSGERDEFDILTIPEDDYIGGGVYLPLDWVEIWCPEAKEAWEQFMNGQAYCEYGFYLRDVYRFLGSKTR